MGAHERIGTTGSGDAGGPGGPARSASGLDPARLAVATAAALLLLAGLGRLDLWAPDEPRYAQIAQQVLADGAERGAESWFLLRLGEEAYTQKPPLYYWLAAAAGAPGGRVEEWAARLPSALAGIGCVWLTALLGRRLFPDGRAGLWSAAVLLTVFRFVHLSRRVQLDVLLSFLELAALLLFWIRDRDGERGRAALTAGLHACLGLALLTKGPVGALPLLVALVYLAWERRARDWRGALPIWGWILSLGPVLGWLAVALALAPPGFFGEAVVENLIGRFFAGTSHARPFYYFAIQLPLDFLPWTLLWPWAWLEARRAGAIGRGPAPSDEARAWRFLLVWIGVFFVFFSLSAGKRGLYLLPAFPALALVCGRTLDRALARRADWPRWLTGALLVLGAVLGGTGIAVAVLGPVELASAPGFALPRIVGAAVALAVGGGWLWAWAWVGVPGTGRATRKAVGVVAAIAGVELAVFTLAYPAFDPEKSPRPIAELAVRGSPGSGPIGVFDHRSMVGGLLYYGGRQATAIPDAEALRRFWDAGGGAVAVRRSKLDRLHAAGPMQTVGSVRHGRREVVVVVPAPR